VTSETAIVTEEEPDIELVIKPRSKSVIWTLFGFKSDANGKPINENRFICQLCQQSIAVKGDNTSNLFSHLKNYHHKKYSELKAGNNDLSTRAGKGKQVDQPKITEALTGVQKYS